MKSSWPPSQTWAIARRTTLVARPVLASMLLLLACGCSKDWVRPSCADDDGIAVTTAHYQDAVSHMAPAYPTGVALEIPDDPGPLTSDNPEAEEKWQLTLREAIEIALEHSKIVRQLRGGVAQAVATQWDAAIAETKIDEELARFDTSLILNLFWGDEHTLLNNNITPGGIQAGAGQIFRQVSFNGGRGTGLQGSGDLLTLRKFLADGGQVSVGFNTDFTLPNLGQRLFRSAYESKVFTTFQQPLLNGNGVDVNRTPIVIARLKSDEAMWEFRLAVGNLIRDVEEKYWDLVHAQVNLWAADEAVKANYRIVSELKERVEAGNADRGDFAQADFQFQKSRRERIQSQGSQRGTTGSQVSGLQFVERELRGLLGLPSTDRRRIVAVDEPIVAPVKYDWNTIRAEAFLFNPDIQRLKLVVAEQREQLKAASNSLLPRIDVFVRAETTSAGDNFGDTFHQMKTGELFNVTYGFQGQYDFGYRKEAARFQAAALQLASAKALLADEARKLVQSLSQNYGEVINRRAAHEAAAAARVAAEERLKLQQELFDLGKIQLNVLQDAVTSYTEALRNEIQDKVEYQIALAGLETAMGTITRYDNVHIHEGPWDAAAYPQAARQAADRRRAIEWYDGPKHNLRAQETVSAHDEPDATIYGTARSDPASLKTLPAVPQAVAKGPREITLDLSKRKPPSSDRDVEPVFVSPAGLESGKATEPQASSPSDAASP